MPFTYQHARPSVTVDNVVIGFANDGTKHILLIKRGRQGTPFYGYWALPGGFVDENEDLEVAARRELREETHVEAGMMIQVGAYGKPGRDPRGHVISVAYVTMMQMSQVTFRADDDAKEAKMWPMDALPDLAFDHADIIADVRKKLP